MSEGKGGVSTKTLTINGQEIEIHYCAYIYPTETAAKNAWERADKRRKRGKDHFSVFRQQDAQTNEWYVIALSEKLAQTRSVRRLIVAGGLPFEPEDEHLTQLVLRRARVISSSPGAVMQTGRYGKSGAIIDDQGFLHPHKRPQG